MPQITFVDNEVQHISGKFLEIGATDNEDGVLHSLSLDELQEFISRTRFACGHNGFDRDKAYPEKRIGERSLKDFRIIDNLFLSPYTRHISDTILDENAEWS